MTAAAKDSDPAFTMTRGELEAMIRKAAQDAVNGEWLTTAQVCEQYQVSPSTIARHIDSGALVPARRATSGGKGKTHRFRRADVEAWFSGQQRGG